MSECPFCKAHVPDGASVCGSCGAEEVVGYVSQQTVKALVAVGALIGIPTGVVVAFMTKSNFLMAVVMFGIIFGPLAILKLRNRNKLSWVRRSVK